MREIRGESWIIVSSRIISLLVEVQGQTHAASLGKARDGARSAGGVGVAVNEYVI